MVLLIILLSPDKAVELAADTSFVAQVKMIIENKIIVSILGIIDLNILFSEIFSIPPIRFKSFFFTQILSYN